MRRATVFSLMPGTRVRLRQRGEGARLDDLLGDLEIQPVDLRELVDARGLDRYQARLPEEASAWGAAGAGRRRRATVASEVPSRRQEPSPWRQRAPCQRLRGSNGRRGAGALTEGARRLGGSARPSAGSRRGVKVRPRRRAPATATHDRFGRRALVDRRDVAPIAGNVPVGLGPLAQEQRQPIDDPRAAR